MVEESKNKKYIVVNNIKVFIGLPVISKKTMTIDSNELKNNEEFEVINVDSKTIEIKNDRLTCIIKHTDFKHFDMAYCITTHVSQGSTYNFPYSIYEYKYFDKKLLYTAMSRSTNKSNINFIDIYLKSEVGYLYILLLTIIIKYILVQVIHLTKDGNNIKQPLIHHHYIQPCNLKALKILNLKSLIQLIILIKRHC